MSMPMSRYAQDILEDEALHLDWMLKFSFMQDIVKVRSAPLRSDLPPLSTPLPCDAHYRCTARARLQLVV